MAKSSNGMGNIGAMLRVLGPLNGANTDAVRNRQLLADFCRLVGSRVGKNTAGGDLPPRIRQTLASLLGGYSEKQIANSLRLSQHTVHVYVKQIYRHYKVSSRGELLARWIQK